MSEELEMLIAEQHQNFLNMFETIRQLKNADWSQINEEMKQMQDEMGAVAYEAWLRQFEPVAE